MGVTRRAISNRSTGSANNWKDSTTNQQTGTALPVWFERPPCSMSARNRPIDNHPREVLEAVDPLKVDLAISDLETDEFSHVVDPVWMM